MEAHAWRTDQEDVAREKSCSCESDRLALGGGGRPGSDNGRTGYNRRDENCGLCGHRSARSSGRQNIGVRLRWRYGDWGRVRRAADALGGCPCDCPTER